MAPDKAHIERYFALLGVTNCCRCSGIRDRYNNVSFNRIFFCERSADFFSEFVYIFAKYGAALFGKVNMFKDTVRRFYGSGFNEKSAVDTVFIESDNFARGDFADSEDGSGVAGGGRATLNGDILCFRLLYSSVRGWAQEGRRLITADPQDLTIRPFRR